VLTVLEKQTAPLVGADIVELNPACDFNGLTANLAAKLVKEFAALHARNGGGV
jgi:arginase